MNEAGAQLSPNELVSFVRVMPNVLTLIQRIPSIRREKLKYSDELKGKDFCLRKTQLESWKSSKHTSA